MKMTISWINILRKKVTASEDNVEERKERSESEQEGHEEDEDDSAETFMWGKIKLRNGI